MRWIFLTLLFVNAGYFGWHMYQQALIVGAEEVIEQSAQLNNINVVEQTQSSGRSDNAAVTDTDKQCIRLGPFKRELHVEQALTRLSSLDISGMYQAEQVELVKDYWVYMPPFPDVNSAKLKLAELNKKGIDSYLISTGALENGLSLGLFGQKNNALTRQRELQSQGYNAGIRENKTTATGYWLTLTPTGSAYFNDGLMESLLVRYPEISQSSVPCKTVETIG